MHVHLMVPWLPIAAAPAQKQEKTQKPKTAERSLNSFPEGIRRAPPRKDGYEDDDPPGETIDLVV